jgi:hypothetical protein
LRRSESVDADTGQPVAIRLAGRVGNPMGIGARITVVREDGSLQSTEIHAGSGYLSQSSAVAFLASTSANPIREIQVSWPSGVDRVYRWNKKKQMIIKEL